MTLFRTRNLYLRGQISTCFRHFASCLTKVIVPQVGNHNRRHNKQTVYFFHTLLSICITFCTIILFLNVVYIQHYLVNSYRQTRGLFEHKPTDKNNAYENVNGSIHTVAAVWCRNRKQNTVSSWRKLFSRDLDASRLFISLARTWLGKHVVIITSVHIHFEKFHSCLFEC